MYSSNINGVYRQVNKHNIQQASIIMCVCRYVCQLFRTKTAIFLAIYLVQCENGSDTMNG